MKKCESCGKLFQEGRDVFCPHCGAVASRECNHGSSFDSSRYDRGEDYNGDPQNTYTQGSEPHAQREKFPFNRYEHTFGDMGKNPQETPRRKFPVLSGKAIGIVVACALVFFRFVFLMVDYDTDFNEIYTDEVSVTEAVYYPEVKNASVAMVEDEYYQRTIELTIGDLYFVYDDPNAATVAAKGLEMGSNATLEGCTFSESVVDEKAFDEGVNYGWYIDSTDTHKPGVYSFSFDFEYDEILYIYTTYISLDNGAWMYVELPFDAFSISEDGSVTYYVSTEETNGNTVFEETDNIKDIIDYDTYINLNDTVAKDEE